MVTLRHRSRPPAMSDSPDPYDRRLKATIAVVSYRETTFCRCISDRTHSYSPLFSPEYYEYIGQSRNVGSLELTAKLQAVRLHNSCCKVRFTISLRPSPISWLAKLIHLRPDAYCRSQWRCIASRVDIPVV